MKYGSRLREIIKAHPINQAEVADKIGVSKSTISFWINSEYPPLDGIEAVCKVIGIPLYKFFMTDEDVKELTGVDPEFLEIVKMVKHMPEEVQIKIKLSFVQILDMMQATLEQYAANMQASLDARRSAAK